MRLGGYFFTFGAVSCSSDCRDYTDFLTTDCTDYTDFSSQEATMAGSEQSEWQEPPRLKNPYNPCNPLWKNTSET